MKISQLICEIMFNFYNYHDCRKLYRIKNDDKIIIKPPYELIYPRFVNSLLK